MKPTLFCYEIHENYGLATNVATGEKAKAYTSVGITFDRVLTEEEYKEYHENNVVQLLVEQVKIEEKFIKPISIEQYLIETVEEDEETEFIN